MHPFKPSSRRAKQPKSITTGDVLTQLARILPSLGASVVAISAIGYLLGWLMVRTYYDSIGANWYYKTFSSTTMFREASNVLMFLAGGLVVGIKALMSGTETKTIVKWDAGIGIAGCIIILIVIPFDFKQEYEKAYYIAAVGCMVVSVVGGLILAELISSLKDSRLKWSGSHISLLVTVFSLVLLYAPITMESSRAKFDMSPTQSTLPYAKKIGCQSCIWRLVNVVEDKALLARISDQKAFRVFQIVSLTDEWVIEPYNVD